LTLGAAQSAQAQQSDMTFFVTSVGLGKGGDLGGLAGADKHCQSLAQAAGAVNARDRIGKGPWKNATGEVIAKDIEELHGENHLTKQTVLTEKGMPIN